MTDVAERFKRETAHHEMTVLRDDGLYRHVRFQHVELDAETGKRKISSFYWFDLITWPGCLTVNGDCGTFTFARTTDMFEFFRGQRINPSYWAEKVRARDISSETTGYSTDKFKRQVAEYVAEAEKDFPGLAAAVEDQFFGFCAEWDTGYESEARRALNDFSYQPDGGSGEPFRFEDTWEWDLRDFDWQYLWCCHAIQWGISLYDKQRGEDVAVAYAEKAQREALVNA